MSFFGFPVSRFLLLGRLVHVPSPLRCGSAGGVSNMSISKLFALVPVCVMAVACGGGATPDAAAPEGAAAAEQKPADAPKADDAAKPADDAAKPADAPADAPAK